MSKKIILNNHQELEINVQKIIRYGLEIIKPLHNSPFARVEIEEKKLIIEGFFLKACAMWEKFLEAEVVLLAYMDITNILEEFELPKNTTLNLKVMKSMIFSNLYRDFNDMERSKNIFKTFIADKYNLFKHLNNEQLKKIGSVYKLRNYLAHSSEFAKRKLLQDYQKIYGISRFKEPSVFLMNNSGKYFEKLLHNFVLASIQMKSKL